MPDYRIRYAGWTRRPSEVVRATDVRREGAWLVLENWVLVIDRPRCVVALRVVEREVAELTDLSGGSEIDGREG